MYRDANNQKRRRDSKRCECTHNAAAAVGNLPSAPSISLLRALAFPPRNPSEFRCPVTRHPVPIPIITDGKARSRQFTYYYIAHCVLLARRARAVSVRANYFNARTGRSRGSRMIELKQCRVYYLAGVPQRPTSPILHRSNERERCAQ